MAGKEMEASQVLAPFGDATTSNVRLFTAAATHKVNALPLGWADRYVAIRPIGGNLWYQITKVSAQEVDSSIAAADAGAESAKLGSYVPDGELVQVILPPIAPGETLYFAREASATCSVEIRKASGPNL